MLTSRPHRNKEVVAAEERPVRVEDAREADLGEAAEALSSAADRTSRATRPTRIREAAEEGALAAVPAEAVAGDAVAPAATPQTRRAPNKPTQKN